jgi:DNA-binding NarL/FixJ family response regulator
VTIGVSADLPALARGLAAILRLGDFDVTVPADVNAWLVEADDPVLVLALETPDLATVVDLRRRRPDAEVVVLLPDPDEQAQVGAFKAGAAAVASWRVTPEVLLPLIGAVTAHLAVLPLHLVRRLTSQVDARPVWLQAASQEAGWLRALAAGSTVADLASAHAYSEREMYRLLADLYDRLGVAGRIPALMLAARYGLFDPD